MTWWMWLLVVLFGLGLISNNNKEAEEKKAVSEANQENLRRRKEAEDYIMSSGDPEAIKMLMLARANPANYSQVLAGGMNKGNDTLKIALGVMTGVMVGNLVANAITASAISSALEGMQADLSKSLSEIDVSDATDAVSSIDFDT
jgi:hypothetical protein